MPLPNGSQQDAEPITIPWTITLDVADLPVGGAWYKFEPGPLDVLYSMRRTAGTSIKGNLDVPDGGVIVASIAENPLQQPVVPPGTYYIQLVPDVGGGTSTFDVEPCDTTSPLDAGLLLVSDDSNPFPGLVFDYSGHFKRALVLPGGELGDVLPSAVYALSQTNTSGMYLFDRTFTQIWYSGANFISSNGPAAICSDMVDRFYVSSRIGSRHYGFRAVGADGTILGSWDINNVAFPTSIGGFAVFKGAGETQALYGATGVAGAIFRLNLSSGTFGTTFAAGIASATPKDIVCLPDDTVLVEYNAQLPGTDFVKHYASDGSVLGTFSAPDNTFEVDHICRYRDTSDSFVLWTQSTATIPFPSGQSNFRRFRLSDGAILDEVTYDIFNTGVGPAGSSQLFGPDQSCPVLVLMEAATVAKAVRLTQLPIEAAYGYPIIQPLQSGAAQTWNTPPPVPSLRGR